MEIQDFLEPEPPTVIDEGKPYTMQDAKQEISDMMDNQSELRERLKQIDRIRKGARETLPKQPQRNRGWEMEH